MATIEDAFKASLEYFGGDELAANVFATKYALSDKSGNILELTPADMFRRVAKEFARIESKYKNPMTEDEIFNLMDGFKYVVPQGSPLSAIGNNHQVQSVSNCFVIESPYDSYGGIMKTDQELVQISKRRGGVGFDLSSIRPKGLATMNAAKTTDGIEVFMERFSNSCREVAQNGRRGALMLTLDVHYPQVMDFIKIKQNKTKITGANISLRVSDEFMKAVEANEDYEQRWPVNSKNPVITKRVNARDVWNEIIKAAHGFAEPGVLFWDTILNDSPADIYSEKGFRTVSTNPCFTGDTRVAVADGRGSVTFKQLVEEGKDVPVYAYENKTGKLVVKLMRNPRLTGKKSSVCEVKMEDGISFKVTGNHKMILWNGLRKSAEDLCANDLLWSVRHTNLQSVPEEARELIANNLVKTDTVTRPCEWCQNDFTSSWKKREQAFCSSECSTSFADNKNDVIKKRASTLNSNSPKSENFESQFIIKTVSCGKEDVFNGTVDDEHTVCTVLSESSDGSVVLIASEQCGEIVLCERDSCRLLLVNLLSFVNNPYTKDSSFDYEKYNEVVIKAQRLMDDLIDLELEQIEKIIKKIDSDPEPESIKRIERDLWIGVREKAILGRRTGLGITALGDTLAALGIKYGSDESINMTSSIYKNLALSSYMSSTILAEERGKFPLYDYDLERNHPFISRLISESDELDKRLKLFGRRNIAITTTAPAGSMSTMTQTSSGIEPAIFIDYTRRKKVNAHEENARVDFVDQSGDMWSEYKVYHHGYTKWKEINNKTDEDIASSPYWNATANEIDPVQKVKMQAAAQNWVCHSISNTCNLPNDVSLQVVNDIYMQAWKTKCKGVTVYRDGSRTGVLVEKSTTEETSERAESFVANHAPKRPETLKCDIYRSSVGNDDWTIIVGLLDNKPYEIMGGFSSKIEIPRKYKTGLLDKKSFKSKQSVYTLRIGEGDDELSIKDVVSTFENPNHASFTRLLSLSLRHGAPVNYIVEQLLKGDKDADLFSLSKVISRVMKQYITNGVKPGGTADCTACGAKDSLRYTEGCLLCVNCSFSKCQ